MRDIRTWIRVDWANSRSTNLFPSAAYFWCEIHENLHTRSCTGASFQSLSRCARNMQLQPKQGEFRINSTASGCDNRRKKKGGGFTICLVSSGCILFSSGGVLLSTGPLTCMCSFLLSSDCERRCSLAMSVSTHHTHLHHVFARLLVAGTAMNGSYSGGEPPKE